MKKFDKVYKTIIKESTSNLTDRNRLTYGELLNKLKQLSPEQLKLQVWTCNNFEDKGMAFTEVIDVKTIEDIAIYKNESDDEDETYSFINDHGFKKQSHVILLAVD